MKYYQCPNCEKRIPIIVLISARYNYCCPNCNTSFTKFERCDN